MHSINYFNTFIAVADDTVATESLAPPVKDPRSAARIVFELAIDSPYQYTSDDLLYLSQGEPKGLRREEFFAKPKACFRTSALSKRYGVGIHSDEKGRVKLVPMESTEYQQYLSDPKLKHLKASRSKR